MLTKLIAKYCPVDGVDPSDLQVLKIELERRDYFNLKQTRDESSITGPQSVVTLISDFAFLHHVLKMNRIKRLMAA